MKLSHNELLLGLGVIVIILIIISFIKKVAKIIIYALIGLLVFFVINAVSSNKSPEAVFNSTKSDAVYTKEIYSYTGKIKTSVDNTMKGIENRALPQLKEENKNLHKYLDEVTKLPHGKELDSFHEKYRNYLENIVITSDTAVKSGDFINGTTKSAEEAKDKINKALDGLTNMKINSQ